MMVDLFLTLIVILLAKGWGVTTNVLSKTTRVVTLCLGAALLMSYIALFVWDYNTYSSPTTFYFYESIPGFIILGIRVLCVLWFCVGVVTSIRKEQRPEKRPFYYFLIGFYSLWFLSLPILVLIASLVTAPYRAKVRLLPTTRRYSHNRWCSASRKQPTFWHWRPWYT